MAGVDLKVQCVKDEAFSHLVLPSSNREDLGSSDMTPIYVDDLVGLIKTGFREDPASSLDALDLDDNCYVGRVNSYTILIDNSEEELTAGGFPISVDCAILPGIGEVIITGQVRWATTVDGSASCAAFL